MQQGRILFTDIDGTLLSDDMTVSVKNKKAIEKALGHGHYVVAATGRPIKSGKAVVEKLGLTMPGCYMIAFNGSVLYDCHADRILHEETIPLPYVQRLLEEAGKAGVYIQTYDRTDVLAEKKTKELEYYSGRTGMSYRLVPNLKENLEREPCKALLIHLESRQVLEDFQKANEYWTKDILNSFFSSSTYLEYCPLGVNKGSAIRRLCSILDIPMEHTIAVGDEWNDISMIEAAHIGVAVKNAVPAAKEAADYVTERDNNHDAVAEVIEKFMFRNWMDFGF